MVVRNTSMTLARLAPLWFRLERTTESQSKTVHYLTDTLGLNCRTSGADRSSAED